jgi:hypothetical protein
LLLPDFALILLGAAIRRWMHLGDHFWNGVEKLVYFILFPALLINAIVKTRLDLAAALPLLATAFAALAAGMALGLLPKLFTKLPALTYASMFQCAYRFNSYIALAVAGMLFGAPGIATMGLIVGAAVPVVNLVSVLMLARHGESGLWREVARNPLIWGTAAGFVLNLAGFVPRRRCRPSCSACRRVDRARPVHLGSALRLDGTTACAALPAGGRRQAARRAPRRSPRRAVRTSGLNYQVAVLFDRVPPRRRLHWRCAWAATGAASPV